jgi:hypothetical protein
MLKSMGRTISFTFSETYVQLGEKMTHSTIYNRSKVKRKKSEESLTKDKLVEIITGLLESNADLGFLLKMEQAELETLVACIRDRVDRAAK